MNKVFLFVIFASILVFPSLTYADGPYLNIPPTNAFDKIHSDNGTIDAVNFSMPLNIKSGSGISVKSNNSTHTLTIINSALSSIQGTYNTTQANNALINSGGYKINFINGSGSTVHVQNSKSGTQVNVTVSSTGSGGTITSINSQVGPAVNIVGQTGNITITNSTNQIQIGVGTNIPILNGKNQTFLKPVAFTSNATRAGLTLKPFATIPTNLQDGDLYHLATQLRFKNGANDRAVILDDGQQTMVNKIFLSGGVSSLADNADNTKRIQWLLSGMSASTSIQIRGNATQNEFANIPNLVSTDTFMMQVAQNQTSDANAITNIPITNHHCAFYFVTGNSTFRNICNFNGVVHVLSKG